jgi:spermidine/putrescine-binding protein
MQRKHLFALIAILLIAMMAVTACGGKTPEAKPATEAPKKEEAKPTEAPKKEEAKPTEAPKKEEPKEAEVKPADEIVVYNWSDYVAPEMYELFTEKTGIKISEDNFSSNEDLLAKLQGGATGYAVIVPSDYTVSIMIEEGLLQELNHDNIPNLKNLDPEFTKLYYDPGNKYCVPYLWGTTGIGYNTEQMETPPASWKQIFNTTEEDAWFGRFTLLDDVREVFSAALIYLGYDNNTKDEAKLEEAKQVLIAAKKGVAGYDTDNYEDLVGAGENLLAHGWNGDFLQAADEYENIDYYIPEEGGTIWIDNMCIPQGITPEQKLAAEMYINFVLDPEIGDLLGEYNYYASPNAETLKIADPEYTSNPLVFPPDEIRAKLHFIKPLGEFESVYQRMWDEVKSAQ